MNAAIEVPQVVTRPTIAAIQAEVSRYYGLPSLEMVSQRRGREIARPRQVAMFLCRELTTHSLPRIGDFFGGRDHTTVMHGCKVIEALIFDDPIIQQDVRYLKARLA